jgi:hypothetical protein
MAAVDRMAHRGIVLEFELQESLRVEESRRRNSQKVVEEPVEPPRIGPLALVSKSY